MYEIGEGEEGEVILVRSVFGKTGSRWLDEHLHKTISVSENDLIGDYEHNRFIRQRPPPIYTMQVLWTDVFQDLCNINENYNDVDLDTIVKTCQDYYALWYGTPKQRIRIRRKWIRDAMKLFQALKLAEPLDDKEEKFRIYYGKNRHLPKDILEYFISQLCAAQAPKRTRPVRQDTLDRYAKQSNS